MLSLLNYFKVFENKLNQGELPETQFLDTSHYKNENFNANSFAKIIMEKLENSNALINRLEKTIEDTRNEIVEQINSNVNNYIVLISKLQAIDFLIENIDKPLINIKNIILNEINFIEKYESDLSKVSEFISDNDNQVRVVLLSLKFFKYYQKCKAGSSAIQKKHYSNHEISNILSNHQDDDIVNHYDVIRRFLVEILIFMEKYDTLHQLHADLVTETVLFEEIQKEANGFIETVDALLRIVVKGLTGKKQYTEIHIILLQNLLTLITKIHHKGSKKAALFDKITNTCIKHEFLAIFDEKNSNRNINQKIEQLISTYEHKYRVLNEVISANSGESLSFPITCLIEPLIERLSNEKFIFNCIEPSSFKDNYNSIISFFNKFINKNNFAEVPKEVYQNLASFTNKFSFFTYYQFIHNEVLRNLYEENTGSDDVFVKELTNISNMIFNYTKTLQEMFRDKKVFVKLLHFFLTFVTQTNKYIVDKQITFFKSDAMMQLMALTESAGFSYEESNMLSHKRSMMDYVSNVTNYYNFFKTSFYHNIVLILDKEVFMFNDYETYNTLVNKLEISSNLICDYISINLFEKEYRIIERLNEEVRRSEKK